MLVDVIGGARPNFVKIASIVHAIQQANNPKLEFRIIHTGQHYDELLSGSFFSDLRIPKPTVNLEVGSGSQAEQTGTIMMSYERVIKDTKPDLCVVVGDVNSTMACAITARKCGVDVAHVEAGIRSGDWSMPEEVNRIVTDSIANWFYTTTKEASNALISTGVAENRVFWVGNTMIDTLLRFKPEFKQPACWQSLSLQSDAYFVVTLHRPSNVDEVSGLIETLDKLSTAAREHPLVFPIHPRTLAALKWRLPQFHNVQFIDPLPYLEFNFLVQHAMGVVTDSGGVTEETTVMGIPTITVRDSTERPETVALGTNVLAGTDPEAVALHMQSILAGTWKKGSIPDLWDGKAGHRIAAHFATLAGTRKKGSIPELRDGKAGQRIAEHFATLADG